MGPIRKPACHLQVNAQKRSRSCLYVRECMRARVCVSVFSDASACVRAVFEFAPACHRSFKSRKYMYVNAHKMKLMNVCVYIVKMRTTSMWLTVSSVCPFVRISSDLSLSQSRQERVGVGGSEG